MARQRGTSEAEIIRRAIDRETALQDIAIPEDSHVALEEILQAAYARRSQPATTGEPYRFNRDDLYEDRKHVA